MGVNDQNVNKDLAPLEKIYEEETIFDTDMFSSHQNATCSAESSPLLEHCHIVIATSNSANGWSDVFSPNEYPSPLSSEVLLEKMINSY
ncbi:hypothetical protein CEXT_424571 [Caerostris extrusa]|uniref:Uncharacterized protein n=1 Tax=Caerostris extrusa TaxID=172846 RepID=A0AAV4XL27_CAEEX|nr:hypothetical protein CEXT_424571 [Caerostris extrusa]